MDTLLFIWCDFVLCREAINNNRKEPSFTISTYISLDWYNFTYTHKKSASELREHIFYFILFTNMFFSYQSKQEKCCAVLKCRLSGPSCHGKLWCIQAGSPTECGLSTECCSLLSEEILKHCRVMAINVATASISALSLKSQKAKEREGFSCQSPEFHPSNTAW